MTAPHIDSTEPTTMTAALVDSATSADGTAIACWRSGRRESERSEPEGGEHHGDPLVVVHGGTADHTRWRTVLPLLAPAAAVYAMDRRGRGGSGDADDYALTREFEDVCAVVDAVASAAARPVDLLGHSFGAICALEAARLTATVRRLVLYEPPFVLEGHAVEPGLVGRLEALLAQGCREAVIETFFREQIRMPDHELAAFRSLPAWQARVDAAHTLPRELHAVDTYRLASERFASVTVPVLLLVGGDSPAPLRATTEAVAGALPDARVVVLPGQQHVAMDTAPQMFADAVLRFLSEG